MTTRFTVEIDIEDIVGSVGERLDQLAARSNLVADELERLAKTIRRQRDLPLVRPIAGADGRLIGMVRRAVLR